jgi:predicted phage gp36 major capsid-like protein
MTIDAMKQALDDICRSRLLAVNSMSSRAAMIRLMDKAIATLRQAIAEAEDAVAAEREACAKVCETECAMNDGITCAEEIRQRGGASDMSEKSVRVSDKNRDEWVDLTADEIWEVFKMHDSLEYMNFARAIEAELREKNT